MIDTLGRVSDLAAQRGLSILALCRLAGLNYTTVSAAKYRKGQLSLDTIERICGALRISLAEFFEETGEKDA